MLGITYSNGAKMPLWAYAAMAARSARIESQNIGAIGRALQSGTDLVEMTTMPQCCRLCGAYQGKVYSVSGKDKRFPALFKTVLKNGYALPHPNCRHEFIPWYEEMEAPEDVEKAIRKSKIKYDSKGELVDVRYQKDIKAYQEWQAGNRQLNRELLEFQRMQEHYAKKKQPAPYTTLAGFRRARRSDNLSPAFKAWRYRKADEKQYKRWKEVVGVENMPKDVDNFQQMKYNKDTYQDYLRLQNIFLGYSRYKFDNPRATPKDYQTIVRLKEQGVQGKIRIPSKIMSTKGYTFRDAHVNNERKRNLTREFAENVIQESIVSIVQWGGKRILYYSLKGASVIDIETKEIITTWDAERFDDKVKNIIEEIVSNDK